MSRSLNKAMLIGNVTRDPETRDTKGGTQVVTFGVATNRAWTSGNGEHREETQYHRIVAWDKLGSLVQQYVHKGSLLYVEGRLQTRKYTTTEGAERESTEIVADEVMFLDKRGPQEAPENIDIDTIEVD